MNALAASWMGKDQIRYLRFVNGRWRWRPEAYMREHGFRMINLSHGEIVDGKPTPSADDKAQAVKLNDEWDRVRQGLPPQPAEQEPGYAPGTIGEAYLRVMRLREQERRSKGIVWTKEQHSRDDWPRAWKWIEPLFGDCDPKTVTPEQIIGDTNKEIIGLRPLVVAKVSESEAHRVIKVWRALWKKMAVLGYCEAERDPSLMFVNPAPAPRSALWLEGEAVRLVKRAWREGYLGLAALLAAAWDSQLSPVDARKLSAADRENDPAGTWFEVDRTKTGRGALATLSRRSERVLEAYLRSLGAEPVGRAPIFRNRSGAPYSKDTLGDDFRDIRTLEFGAGETRWLSDFRRSGAAEAVSGDVAPGKLSAKMANTISTSNRLHQTYSPTKLADVRDADAARKKGRARLREQNGTKTVTAPARKLSRSDD